MAPHTGRVTIFPSAAVTDTRLGAAAFRVLAALGRHGDKYGWCFVSLKTLAGDLGVTRQAISKNLQQLAALGYVQIEAQSRADNSRTVNRYRVVLDYDGDGADMSPRQREVDTPRRGVDTPQPLEVDTPQPLEVDTPQPLEVDALTSHRNDPSERPIGTRARPRPARVALDSYQPSEAMRQWAQEACPGIDLAAVVEQWRDWHAARGTAIKDYDASLRTWVRRERPPAGAGRALPFAPVGRDAERVAVMERFIARRQGQ